VQVRLIRIFVSSPGDVGGERRLMDEVVAAINRTDGQAGAGRRGRAGQAGIEAGSRTRRKRRA